MISIKIALQLGSIYPPLGKIAFGFRPIIIGYLHLVLLGVITIFLLGFIVSKKYILLNKKSIVGIGIFICGIIFNEGLLLNQGVFAMKYENVPYINELLLLAAVVMLSGITTLTANQFRKSENEPAAPSLSSNTRSSLFSKLCAESDKGLCKILKMFNKKINRLWGRWRNKNL